MVVKKNNQIGNLTISDHFIAKLFTVEFPIRGATGADGAEPPQGLCGAHTQSGGRLNGLMKHMLVRLNWMKHPMKSGDSMGKDETYDLIMLL